MSQEDRMRMKQWGWMAVSLGLLSAVLLAQLPLAAQSQRNDSAALSERATIGKEIFNDRCYLCHDVDSARRIRLGPPLDGLFRKTTLVVGKPVNEENVKEVIKMGPTPGMPGFRYMLSDQQIDDVVAYLKTR